jgi:hypothetical protein
MRLTVPLREEDDGLVLTLQLPRAGGAGMRTTMTMTIITETALLSASADMSTAMAIREGRCSISVKACRCRSIPEAVQVSTPYVHHQCPSRGVLLLLMAMPDW